MINLALGRVMLSLPKIVLDDDIYISRPTEMFTKFLCNHRI